MREIYRSYDRVYNLRNGGAMTRLLQLRDRSSRGDWLAEVVVNVAASLGLR